jgi:hypothetical protein
VWMFARNILRACLYVVFRKSHFISPEHSILTAVYHVIIEFINTVADLDSYLHVEVLAAPSIVTGFVRILLLSDEFWVFD